MAHSKVEEWNNYKNPESGMDRFGKPRLELALFLRDNVLDKFDFPWMIEAGTLLGAWRSGRFIPHDDDFDIALLLNTDDCEEMLSRVFAEIKGLLPTRYEARMITSYTQKIEVYDPSYGEYVIQSPNLNYFGKKHHHVTVDLQPYLKINDVYRSLYHSLDILEFSCDDLFPLEKMILEGEYFPVPKNCETILKTTYGSLDPKAKYNFKTGKYELPKDS